jgi:hypothetical protein
MKSMAKTILTDAAILAARRRGTKAQSTEPRALAAQYDSARRQIIVTLRSGVTVGIPVDAIDEVAGADGRQLARVALTPIGDALHWDELDVDISLPGLLQDALGASLGGSILGKVGGSAKSPAKAASSKLNGTKGGRPRRAAAK